MANGCKPIFPVGNTHFEGAYLESDFKPTMDAWLNVELPSAPQEEVNGLPL